MNSKSNYVPRLFDQRSAIMMEFIKSYKSLSCLWNVNEPSYKDKVKRIESLKLLLQIYKKIDPRANICTVKCQINTLRSNFRRQLRKCQSMKNDHFINKEPNQWKFQMLQFLNPYNSQNSQAMDNIEYNIYEEEGDPTYPGMEMNNDPLLTTIEITPDISIEESPNVMFDKSSGSLNNKQESNRRRSKTDIIVEINENKEDIKDQDYYKNVSDNLVYNMLNEELKTAGLNVAFKLQRMDPSQRNYAEVLINRILIKGLENKLTDNTELMDFQKST